MKKFLFAVMAMVIGVSNISSAGGVNLQLDNNDAMESPLLNFAMLGHLLGGNTHTEISSGVAPAVTLPVNQSAAYAASSSASTTTPVDQTPVSLENFPDEIPEYMQKYKRSVNEQILVHSSRTPEQIEFERLVRMYNSLNTPAPLIPLLSMEMLFDFL
jgi:hypothetical protein